LIHKENRNPNHYINQIKYYEKALQLELVVVEKLKSTLKNNRYICQVKVLDHHKSYGKVILNISKTQNIGDLKIGSHLNVIGQVYKIKVRQIQISLTMESTSRIKKSMHRFTVYTLQWVDMSQVFGQASQTLERKSFQI